MHTSCGYKRSCGLLHHCHLWNSDEVHEYVPYHTLPVLEVSLFQKGCLPQQADRSGNHWECSVVAYWAQDSSLPGEEL